MQLWWSIPALACLAAAFTLLRLSGWRSWSAYDRPERPTDAPVSPVAAHRTWRGTPFLTHVPECLELGGNPPVAVCLRALQTPVELSKVNDLPMSIPVFTVLRDGSRLPGAWFSNESDARTPAGVQVPRRIVFDRERFVVREWVGVKLEDAWVPAHARRCLDDQPVPVEWLP